MSTSKSWRVTASDALVPHPPATENNNKLWCVKVTVNPDVNRIAVLSMVTLSRSVIVIPAVSLMHIIVWFGKGLYYTFSTRTFYRQRMSRR